MTIKPDSIESLQTLIQMLKKTKVTEFSYEGDDGVKVNISFQNNAAPQVTQVAQPVAAPAATPVAASQPVEASGKVQEAPMVGTVYLSPSPDAAPFVTVGSKVSKGDTLCLIEAMKMFNKVLCDHDGVIKRCLLTDAQAVEFGQPLFEIE